MPPSKANKDVSGHIFSKYATIRNTFSDLNPFIENDLSIIKDKQYIFIQLLSKCDIHPNALFKLLNIFKDNSPEHCFSEILINPYKFVLLPENILSFDKANDIAKKFSLKSSIDERFIFRAWVFDFILFKNNKFYIEKTYLIKKFLDSFPEGDIDYVMNEMCMKVKFDTKTLLTLSELYNLEVTMGDMLLDTYLVEKTTDNKINSFIEIYEKDNSIQFTTNQKKAITNATENKLSVICGLPGTGKSTIADCICSYYKDDVICLTAPTGMAVNNIRNKCKVKDSIIGTIHKLLFDGFDIKEKAKEPKLMIVDEFSMVDNVLFNNLLKFCKVFDCKLVLIADDQQLPPIGGGYPLTSIIQSKIFKTVNLKNIKRQSKGKLKDVILKLNKCEKIINTDFDKETIFFYNYSEANIKKLIEKFNLNPTNSQFISPQHKHTEGTVNVNKLLQSIYSKTNTPFYCKQFTKNNVIKNNDYVVRTINHYSEDELFANGDVAQVTNNIQDDCIDVDYIYTNTKQQISINELYEQFDLSYCLTVHKVQGSQYENTVLIIGDNHNFSWTNNDAKRLLYTAISRAQKRCFILGNSELFSCAQSIIPSLKHSLFLKRFNEYDI